LNQTIFHTKKIREKKTFHNRQVTIILIITSQIEPAKGKQKEREKITAKKEHTIYKNKYMLLKRYYH